jgi:tetratricopeptide (TPR) repeat protein
MRTTALTLGLVVAAAALHAQDIPWARDLYIHGLKDRAMESFIAILHTPSTADDRAEALYYIGQISFEQGSFATAMNDWEKLVADYPKSPRALELKDRFTQLREVYSKLADPPLDSVVARSYIKNGDFWAGGERKFSLETKFLPSLDLGVSWYDRVINEFPGSMASDVAMQRKVFLWLSFADEDWPRNLQGLLDAFAAYEAAFPKDENMQAFRYQVSQVYWRHGDWQTVATWLNKIIEASGGRDTFYSDLAKARLENMHFPAYQRPTALRR